MVRAVQRPRGWMGYSPRYRHLNWPSDVKESDKKKWLCEWFNKSVEKIWKEVGTPPDPKVSVVQNGDKWEVIFFNGYGMMVVEDFETAREAEDIALSIKKDLGEFEKEYEGIFSREDLKE